MILRFDAEFFGGLLLGFIIGVLLGAFAFAFAKEQPSVMVTPYEVDLVKHDREAVTEAYKQQITHLFLTWMKDSTGQPERARRGADQARRAFVAIIERIDQREKQLQIPMPPERPR